jgi:hypothetical protein
MKKLLALLLLFGIVGCSASPKKIDELYADKTSYYSPVETIKCMQMPTPMRPHPINKKGETREVYDQDDCYDDLLLKDVRELVIPIGKTKIDLKDKKEEEKTIVIKKESIGDIDIEAIEEKVIKKKIKKD